MTRWVVVSAISLLTPPLILVAYLLASLLLTGGRVSEGRSAIWRPVLEWPVFTVSPWVTVMLSIVALAAVVREAWRASVTRALVLTTFLGWAAASAGSSWFFGVALPPAALAGAPVLGRSDHFLAACLVAIAILILIARLVVVGPAHDRLMRARLLGSGVLRTPDDWLSSLPYSIDAPVGWRTVDAEVLPPVASSSIDAPLTLQLLRSPTGSSATSDEVALRADDGTPVRRSSVRSDDGVITVSYVFSRSGDRRDIARVDAIVRPSAVRSRRELEALLTTADTVAGTFRWTS